MSQSLTLLQIVSAVCSELGLVAPSSVVGSSDLQTQQILALANREGNELYRSHDWTDLQGEHIINLQAPYSYTGDTVLGSALITNLSSTTGIEANAFAVSGTGQPAAQRVLEIVDATTVRCEMESTQTGVAQTFLFQRDTYEIPSDFDRYISHTWWDRTNHWMLVGPQSPVFDQWQRSGIVTTGPRRRWRQIGRRPTVYRIWPPPTSQDTPAALVFEYVNDGWVEHTDGSFGNSFTADTDTSLLNSQALILGIKWRFFQIKGFEYGSLQQEALDFISREKARDGGMADLSMTRRSFPYLLTSANVQDGSFPGSG